MEFGVLFTSHPNPNEEPYPRRNVHARATLDGAAETVIAGMTSLLLRYPPSYGRAKAMRRQKLFAERVIPAFRPPAHRVAAAE